MTGARKWPTGDLQTVATVIFAAILIGFVSLLLLNNYRSLKHLGEHAATQLYQETEKQAAAVSYFFAERKNDLRNLAESRALSAFFENRALGMSMAYGLRASLQAAALGFEQAQAKNFAGGVPIYDRLLFITPDQTVMVDTRPAGRLPDGLSGSGGAASDADPAIEIAAYPQQLALETAYRFKGRIEGSIVALLAVQTIFEQLLQPMGSEPQMIGILHDSGRCYGIGAFSADDIGRALQAHPPPDGSALSRFRIPGSDQGDTDVVAVRIPIDGTPLGLVRVVTAAAVFHPARPWHQLIAMAVMALLLLAGAFQLWRAHTQRLVLRTRLDESSLREAEIHRANDAMRREIEERRAVERALRESEARFKSIFNATHDGVAVYRFLPGTDDFVLVDINQAAQTAERVSRSDVIGRRLSEVFPGAGALGLVEALHRVHAGGGPEQLPLAYYQDEVRSGWRENFVYRLPSGEIVAVYQDKTVAIESEKEKHRIERHLRQAQKMEAIGTLAGGIAHDFNNILAAIMGYAEIVEMSVSPSSPIHRDLKQIIKAAHRAKDLTQQILAFSRESEHEKKPVQLGHIVKETLHLLRASLPSTIDIERDIDDAGMAIMADPIQMHQVIMNLCTNAHHAMEETGGKLRVSLSPAAGPPDNPAPDRGSASGSWMKLSVSDTGQGMEPEIIERIFDPYFTTKQRGKGTGLGLAVVHGIVRDHGGLISVDSTPGRGTSIDIFLPGIAAEAPLEPSLADSMPGGSETVLFVDDEQSLVELGELMLQGLGYRVIACAGSIEALERFSAAPQAVDLVITDMTMPGMTGARLAGKIKAIRPDVPIIMCTGYSEIIDSSRIGAMGIAELMMKPIRLQNFAETIRRVLDEGHLSRTG